MIQNKRILVCDDDDGILDMMELLLEDAGYEVKMVPDATFVVTEVLSFKPDLIILDIWMPVISGDQVLKNLKSRSDTNTIPVMLFSASREGEAVANKAGADSYLRKPFSLDELLDNVAGLLSREA